MVKNPWINIVRKALWTAMPQDHYVYENEVFAVSREIKKGLLQYFATGEPLYFRGTQELILKQKNRKKKKCGQTPPSSDAGQN